MTPEEKQKKQKETLETIDLLIKEGHYSPTSKLVIISNLVGHTLKETK